MRAIDGDLGDASGVIGSRPVCKDYLGRVAEKAGEFADAGMPVVLASMDPQDRAEQAKSEWGLADLPLAYGMSEAQAREWGLYISSSIKDAETATFSEPGLFWVLPDGTLYMAEIASMPFARPSLDILMSKIAAIGNGYPPRRTKG